ncbi:MAG TPA: ParB/RepB/Spo0J family partition protein [Actinomycetota bacterium]|nr:ParB/RepB/Spo0J family partition protein [Actinomycetota bacterium]
MKRRSGLGRGLEALLPSGEGSGLEERGVLREVSVTSIVPNPRQPRRSFDEQEIQELAASVRQLGVLQPLLVRETQDGDRYELIAGERRLRAAKQARLEKVPVVVVETDERGSLERALVENIHRSNLNPIEEAAAYRELMQESGLTQEGLAERLGRNRVTVTNALRLLDLPTDVQRLIVDRRLTAGHGKALLGLDGNPFQGRLARRVAEEGLSVRETEELVRRYQQISSTASSRSPGRDREKPALVSDAQRRLADHLQTRVRIEMGKKKGRIVLDFVSLDELERLLTQILGDSPVELHTVGPEAGGDRA